MWLYVGVAVLAFLPYLGLPAQPLVYDAPATILRNEAVQSGSLGGLFGVDFWGLPLDADYSTRSYRPLVSLTYALQARWAGNAPPVFHLTDIALHGTAAALLALLARTLGLRRRWALFAGALFALHPLQSEAVSSVVGRADLMAAIGLFSALLLHLNARGRPRAWLWDGLALAALAAALLCKEYAVAFPFVLIGVDSALSIASARSPWGSWRFWTAALLLLAAYLLLRFGLIGAVGGVPMLAATDHPLLDAPWIVRWSMAARLLALSGRLLVWPAGLNHHYRSGTLPIVEYPLHPLAFVGAALAVGLLAFGLWRLRRRADAVPLIAWLLLLPPLLPGLNLVSLGGVLFAERHLYVPLAGFAMLVSWALDRAALSDRLERAAVVLAGLILLAAGVSTVTRVEEWASDERLARSSLAAYPHGSEVWRDLGLVVGGAGRHEEALEAFERSVEIEPRAPQTWQAYATALVNLGRHADGARAWRRCVELTPDPPAALWRGLGQAELLADDPASASEALGRALELAPDSPEIVSMYGRALLRQGQQRLEDGARGEALDLARQATRVRGLPAPGFFLAGMLADAAGEERLASGWFERALTLDPGLLRKKHDLAHGLEQSGRYADAAETYREILLAQPDHAATLFNLGRVLLLAGEPEPAVDALRRGLELRPDPRAELLLEQALARTAPTR